MVNRIFVEKKPGLSPESKNLLDDFKKFLNIHSIDNIRILNRYDVEDLDSEIFEQAKHIVFSEPQVDYLYEEEFPESQTENSLLAVEVLPGQFDQRADSSSQSIQLLSGGERPLINYAKYYIFEGTPSEEELEKIKDYLINPVESREATLEKPTTLVQKLSEPEKVKIVEGFNTLSKDELSNLRDELGLAMDLDDLLFLQRYFAEDEKRNPTITEIRVIDTYWSDHCRHTTFGTNLENINIENEEVKESFNNYLNIRDQIYGKDTDRPITLMDIATIGAKALKRKGVLPELDESEEINACSIHVPAVINGKEEDWVLMFKNETHNHPTEIEPFGGAATCIGGCIRDPLSGRTYVHQAMRVTGSADPRATFEETLSGKLPQRKIALTSASGYSSYGNQIGLATGQVAEVYHPGFAAKHLECGAVIGAAPFENIRRETPQPGDVIILLGGRTGRDGIGGATGSSKSHNLKSLSTMASEVQKGNAPEERKLQRLFRNKEVTQLIKRCNDFGAGGVSVAIGELADGLEIDLDVIRKKYEGLDGTELAISESQERMAVVVSPEDVEKFIQLANDENLEAYAVAEVTESPRMVMKWQGETIADLSRAFLNTNGAKKYIDVKVKEPVEEKIEDEKLLDLKELASELKIGSQRGLVERFDGSIGAGSVLMPFGGKNQRTPAQVMSALLPVLPGQETNQASVMSFAFDPSWTPLGSDNTDLNPYKTAKNNLLTSIAKLVAAGADYKKVYLTLQEFFEKLGDDPERWGKPFEALLGALEVQLGLDIAAIGGKDSMSGSFLDLDVPPTVISFAIAPILAEEIITSEFKEANNPVYFVSGDYDYEKLKEIWDKVLELSRNGKVKASYATEIGGVPEALMKMSFGNDIGFISDQDTNKDYFKTVPQPGGLILELSEEIDNPDFIYLGKTSKEPEIVINDQKVSIKELLEINEAVLEDVYQTKVEENSEVPTITFKEERPRISTLNIAKPKVTIPVFPGTNCEYDSARAAIEGGLDPNIVVINNLTPEGLKRSAQKLAQSINESQVLFIPGGFSGGDEPEGSGKFISSFLRNPNIADSITNLLENRDGLILGICNGFQALIKLGLVPYGKIVDVTSESPTLSYNTIGRHQSSIVKTRVSSNLSPWFLEINPGDVFNVPISHGEGRFIASDEVLQELAKNGQIATQYVDLSNQPSMDTSFNPNGSLWAIEGITSPDGRVLGKMGHTERIGKHLYKNIPGNYDMQLFKSAAKYFK